MQYRVPQNIDQEDKILGPLTFVQFIYVLIGGSILLLLFSVLDFVLFLVVAVPITIFTACLALVKVQDQPFTRFITSLVIYLLQPKYRVWQNLQHHGQTSGLGEDFFADAKRDEAIFPNSQSAASQKTPVSPAPAAIPTAIPTATPAPAKILTIQSGNAAPQPIPAATPTATTMPVATTPTELTEPAKPARKLTINVLKGGA